MLLKTLITLISFFLLNANNGFAQEWKNLRSYQKDTEFSSLQNGCWLKKDRKKQNEVWSNANLFNLSIENGCEKYASISQIRDFYLWFDLEREKQGHEIKWIGIAAIATDQLSKVEIGFIRFFLVRNKEVANFAKEGTYKVFEFAYPQLKKVYYSEGILIGKEAENWDFTYGKKEQCSILEPMYKNFSPVALHKLNRMAKGKGLFSFGVPKAIKFEGQIEDCQTRFKHGIYKMISYYLSNKKTSFPSSDLPLIVESND